MSVSAAFARCLKWLGALVLLALLFAAGATAWLWHDMQAVLDMPLSLGGRPQILMVAPGASVKSIAAELERRGLLAKPRYLRLEARLTKKANKIKTGEFEIQPGTTPRELLDLLVGGRVVQHQITLVEGWTFRQMRAALAAHDALVHTLAGLSAEQVMTKLGHAGEHPEGRFFPDTYRFTRDTEDLDVLARAYRKMSRILAREWANRAPDLPYEDPYEALIMASIVEKEASVPEERGQIAGVFVRRLKKRMRLQTDPSVIYGLGEGFDGNLRRTDLDADSPYNTYQRYGLPPTPIANPGLAALHAALHPAAGKALYFVARGDGTHHFSDSLAEHNRAVARFQLQKSR